MQCMIGNNLFCNMIESKLTTDSLVNKAKRNDYQMLKYWYDIGIETLEWGTFQLLDMPLKF